MENCRYVHSLSTNRMAKISECCSSSMLLVFSLVCLFRFFVWYDFCLRVYVGVMWTLALAVVFINFWLFDFLNVFPSFRMNCVDSPIELLVFAILFQWEFPRLNVALLPRMNIKKKIHYINDFKHMLLSFTWYEQWKYSAVASNKLRFTLQTVFICQIRHFCWHFSDVFNRIWKGINWD